jgi:hypothetical protein
MDVNMGEWVCGVSVAHTRQRRGCGEVRLVILMAELKSVDADDEKARLTSGRHGG